MTERGHTRSKVLFARDIGQKEKIVLMQFLLSLQKKYILKKKVKHERLKHF